MDTIRFVDTTLRDGHQSLWAENMTTGMMLPIAKRMDAAGFEGIELISGSHLKKTVRELKEDPWERVRLVAKEITKTPLRVIAGFPELLDGGVRVRDDTPAASFAESRHPRTAVGWDPSTGRLWLVVVDGRQGSYSTGMSLAELSGLLEALGAREALNLDGGGSSVMVVRGRAVSRPSDETGERRVVNALVVVHDPARCQRSNVTDSPTRNVRPGPGSQ